MDNFWKWVRGILLFGFLGLITFYVGACVYANFILGDGKPGLPPVNKAHYAVQIVSTGQILFSDKVTDKGTSVILNGYYEFTDNKFVYRKGTVTMDEQYFGRIDVVKRQVEE